MMQLDQYATHPSYLLYPETLSTSFAFIYRVHPVALCTRGNIVDDIGSDDATSSIFVVTHLERPIWTRLKWRNNSQEIQKISSPSSEPSAPKRNGAKLEGASQCNIRMVTNC
jgi:hypothetical protein